MESTLVILAAGLGQRYGGLKQVEAVGPGGATLLEYSVFDARRAGFGRVVLVIRPEMEAALRVGLGARLQRSGLPVEYAHQRLEDLPEGFSVPAGRTKPWGTGQAVLAAAETVAGGSPLTRGNAECRIQNAEYSAGPETGGTGAGEGSRPFAVINADDFYGRAAFAAVGEFLQKIDRLETGPTVHAMVGYRLWDTLPERGAVARAVCRCGAGGFLEEITEIRGLERADPHGDSADRRGDSAGRRGDSADRRGDSADPERNRAEYTDEAGTRRRLPGDTLVSMNLWGFRPGFLEILRPAFRGFLAASAGAAGAPEFYLPAAVQAAIRSGAARVKVLPATGRWCGLTHAGDMAGVRQTLAELVARGEYPAGLWG